MHCVITGTYLQAPLKPSKVRSELENSKNSLKTFEFLLCEDVELRALRNQTPGIFEIPNLDDKVLGTNLSTLPLSHKFRKKPKKHQNKSLRSYAGRSKEHSWRKATVAILPYLTLDM